MAGLSTAPHETPIRIFSYMEDHAAGDECCVTLAQALAGGPGDHMFCADPGAFYTRWRGIFAAMVKEKPSRRMIYSIGDKHHAVALADFYEEGAEEEKEEEPSAASRHGVGPSPQDLADVEHITRPEAAELWGGVFEFLGSQHTAFYQARGPFMYVKFLGVRPQHQGRGLGSALLRQLTGAADAAGRWCYLEASSDHNMRLYVRHGFEALGSREWSLPSVPGDRLRLVRMARPPAPEHAAAPEAQR